MKNYSVLMPLSYQEQPAALEQSLCSVAGQTVLPHEVVFVCDHATPATLQKIAEKCLKPINIAHFYVDCTDLHQKGGKLGAILARGVEQCQCEYIARMDSDDISMPQRCELQLHALEDNPELAVVGGVSAEFSADPSNIETYRRPPTKWKDIAAFARYRNPFNHPTVMFRKQDILQAGNYDPYLVGCEDYDLWYRVIASGKQVMNLPDVLLLSRAGPEMIKRRRAPQNTASYFRLRNKMLKSGFITPLQYVISATGILFLRFAPQRFVEKLYSDALRKQDHRDATQSTDILD